MSMAMLVRTGLVWLLLFPRHSRRASMSSRDSCSSFIVFLLLPGEISSQLVSSTFPSLHQLTLELGQPETKRCQTVSIDRYRLPVSKTVNCQTVHLSDSLLNQGQDSQTVLCRISNFISLLSTEQTGSSQCFPSESSHSIKTLRLDTNAK